MWRLHAFMESALIFETKELKQKQKARESSWNALTLRYPQISTKVNRLGVRGHER